MSNYIEEARKELALWSENIDIDTFTKQYESLNHGIGGVLLEHESFDSYYQFATNHLENDVVINSAYDSVSVGFTSNEVRTKTNSEMVEEYDFVCITSKIQAFMQKNLIDSYKSAYYDGKSLTSSRRVNNNEFKRSKKTSSWEVA